MPDPQFTTTALLKSWLKITAATEDTLLTALVTASTKEIQTYLSDPILSATYTGEAINGQGQRGLTLKHGPITAVTSLTIDGTAVPAAANSQAAGFMFDDNEVYLTSTASFQCFTRGFKNVVVTYTAGYTVTPFDIAQACLELCAYRYRSRDRIGERSKTFAGQEVSSFITSAMPDHVKAMLDPYRRVTGAM